MTYLIVGLGNPGAKYQFTRHNIGFICVDALREYWKFPEFSQKHDSLCSMGEFSGKKIIIIQPQTFMNLSGKAVTAFMSFYKIPLNHLYVIHDDVELPLGISQCRLGGGARGHNGLRDIDSKVGQNYYRIRCGVGRPPERFGLADYVLAQFKDSELIEIKSLVDNVVNLIGNLFSALT